ncbi:MAG: zinc ABC transporter substrate-binding protein, partial [Synergistaceae bacterium]|nr:zinc ABC transporter substrate-binding protein [Synergistaceae bacterium]
MRFRTAFFLALFLFTASTAQARLSITCTIFPVYDFTREITKGLADVKLLIRGDVHEYEPSPMDIKALNDSDVFIFTNKNMEQWTERISHTLTHTAIIDASENITFYGNDPHVWLDMSLAEIMTRNIMNALCRADSEHADEFRANAEEFMRRLSELDSK